MSILVWQHVIDGLGECSVLNEHSSKVNSGGRQLSSLDPQTNDVAGKDWRVKTQISCD